MIATHRSPRERLSRKCVTCGGWRRICRRCYEKGRRGPVIAVSWEASGHGHFEICPGGCDGHEVTKVMNCPDCVEKEGKMKERQEEARLLKAAVDQVAAAIVAVGEE